MTEQSAAAIIDVAEEITLDWARQLFGTAVAGVEVSRVGTGQIGTCYRVWLTAEAGASGADAVPGSVLVKLPGGDPGARALLAGAYRSEMRFYSQIAPTVAIRAPQAHLAVLEGDGSRFTLVMSDAAPAAQGDQIHGCSPAQAEDAVINLAGLHGPRWCDPTLLEIEGLTRNGPDDAALMAEMFGPATDIFIDALGDLLEPATVDTLRRVAAVIGDWELQRSDRFGLVHGDYRLDNLLFPPEDAPGVIAVDWQTLSLALPARDLAYFTGTSLPTEQRRRTETDLVAAYHRALVGHGVRDYDADLAWEDYRFAMPQGPLVAVFGCAYGTRTDRGDRMFAAMTNRACTAIRDLETLTLVE